MWGKIIHHHQSMLALDRWPPGPDKSPNFRDPIWKKIKTKIFISAAIYDFYLFWAICIWLGSKVTGQSPRWTTNCQNVTTYLQTKSYGKIIGNSRFIPDADDDPSNHPTASTIFLVRSKSEIQRSKLIERCWICWILKQYFDCTINSSYWIEAYFGRCIFF